VQGRVGQRQHAVEFGQGEHGFGGHRVGDRVAGGGEHAAFERRAILARSPHQPYAAKMDRERELKIIRRASKQVTAAAGVGDPQVEAAFAAVAREDFLGPGPGTSVSSLSHDTALTGQSEFHYRRRRR